MKYLVLFCLTLITLLGYGQETNEKLIPWSSTKKLSWNDYDGKPNPSSDAAASTATHLTVAYNIKNNSLTHDIASSFSKTRSWVRVKNDYVLAHEQGHFDLAEVFARKLHQSLTSYQFNSKTFRTDLKKIYDDITDEKERTQQLYDKETNHSINKEQQASWLIRIRVMLDELKDFADYKLKP